MKTLIIWNGGYARVLAWRMTAWRCAMFISLPKTHSRIVRASAKKCSKSSQFKAIQPYSRPPRGIYKNGQKQHHKKHKSLNMNYLKQFKTRNLTSKIAGK
jgi:hypothetical protein